MMGFDVDVVVLLLLAFALGGALAYLLRLRARRRGLEALARATLTAIDPKGAAAEAHFVRAVRPSEPPHGESPHGEPPHGETPHMAPPPEHVPLAPEDPELPLDLPAALPPSLAPHALARGRRIKPPKEAAKRPEPVPPAHGTAPPLLAAPEGAADDLKRLKGIGPQNERRLNALGIFHFRQIAAWTPEEVRWVGATLAFPGRIEREGWVGQARALLAGGTGPDGAPGAADDGDGGPAA
ncbi:hypothetical protein [Azorhizobium doebereinerae]|uniref:hypothetical protein n=1 Tax=Azorhizobium doebereinerae TaxID=281091 RepID=UPI000420F712